MFGYPSDASTGVPIFVLREHVLFTNGEVGTSVKKQSKGQEEEGLIITSSK